MRSIIVHVATESMLRANALYRDGFPKEREIAESEKSSELHYLTNELLDNGWKVYWCVLENINIETLHFSELYDVSSNSRVSLTCQELNDNIDMILVRILGSVEGKLAIVKHYLEQLRSTFKGITVNDPASFIYGLRKDYLFALINANFPTIPTDYFENTVTFAELEHKYGTTIHQYLVKPVTGELSNSMGILGETNEGFFRSKESKVGGWLVQPVIPHIWNGEYQLFFLGNDCKHALKKIYRREGTSSIVPSQHNRLIEEYLPTQGELSLARQLKEFYVSKLNLRPDIFRLDFMKDEEGRPIIVEFETVNPGFFIKYICDARKKQIARDFESFLSIRLA